MLYRFQPDEPVSAADLCGLILEKALEALSGHVSGPTPILEIENQPGIAGGPPSKGTWRHSVRCEIGLNLLQNLHRARLTLRLRSSYVPTRNHS